MKMGKVLSNIPCFIFIFVVSEMSLSYILRCICRCGEAEDDDESDENPHVTSSHLPIRPSIPLSKTLKFIDPSVSNPLHLSDHFALGDSNTNTVALHHNNLLPPPQSVVEERWMKQYSSSQKILLVGEGDFSFSACLAMAFGSAAHNIIATSLDTTGFSDAFWLLICGHDSVIKRLFSSSVIAIGGPLFQWFYESSHFVHIDKGFLSTNYRCAMSNIQSLRSRGAKVMHGVDATQMARQILFRGMTFDHIVFNFPLSGFFLDESRESKLRRERKLVCLFLANAREMIMKRGEIHVTHKSNGFFREWKLDQLASSVGLQLIEEVHFNFTDFPGYHTKYGFGGDKNFNCNPSKTYKFCL